MATTSSNWLLTKRAIIRITAFLLILTSGAKLYESTGNHPYFQEPDSLLQSFTNKQIMLLASAFEIALAAYLLIERSVSKQGAALLSASGLLATYRISRKFTRAVLPCSCLGILSRWLRLSPIQIDVLTWTILFWMAMLGLFLIKGESTGQLQDRGDIIRKDRSDATADLTKQQVGEHIDAI
jgi:hypothetical protein